MPSFSCCRSGFAGTKYSLWPLFAVVVGSQVNPVLKWLVLEIMLKLSTMMTTKVMHRFVGLMVFVLSLMGLMMLLRYPGVVTHAPSGLF